MHAHVLVAFALGIPQHRSFDGLDIARFDRIDLVIAGNCVARIEKRSIVLNDLRVLGFIERCNT